MSHFFLIRIKNNIYLIPSNNGSVLFSSPYVKDRILYILVVRREKKGKAGREDRKKEKQWENERVNIDRYFAKG